MQGRAGIALKAAFLITSLVVGATAALADEQITGFGGVLFTMSKSELEKKFSEKAEPWFGDVTSLTRSQPVTILGSTYKVIYLFRGPKIVAIHVFNLGVLRNQEFDHGISGSFCSEYLKYLYSAIAKKYGNPVLPLATAFRRDQEEDYYAVFESNNGAWLDFVGTYDPGSGGRIFGQEGPCFLNLDYHPSEELDHGF